MSMLCEESNEFWKHWRLRCLKEREYTTNAILINQKLKIFKMNALKGAWILVFRAVIFYKKMPHTAQYARLLRPTRAFLRQVQRPAWWMGWDVKLSLNQNYPFETTPSSQGFLGDVSFQLWIRLVFLSTITDQVQPLPKPVSYSL